MNKFKFLKVSPNIKIRFLRNKHKKLPFIVFLHGFKSDLDGEKLGLDRAVGIPGLSATVAEMLAALETVGGEEARALISMEYDLATDQLVQSWPALLDDQRARDLGFPADADLESMIRSYVEMINR